MSNRFVQCDFNSFAQDNVLFATYIKLIVHNIIFCTAFLHFFFYPHFVISKRCNSNQESARNLLFVFWFTICKSYAKLDRKVVCYIIPLFPLGLLIKLVQNTTLFNKSGIISYFYTTLGGRPIGKVYTSIQKQNFIHFPNLTCTSFLFYHLEYKD